MTQQEQHEFRESLEEALAWMQAIQERLRLSDNTQGPREELEARLRETEEIRDSEQEGRLKMDAVLVAADALLKNGDDEMKNQTHSKLKDLKALWEETSTYIVHCHSRIEWVWLHWSEYLKAHEEFATWLLKQQAVLGPQPELQLGLREKLWQVDHHHVLCSDVKAQAVLLDRLLDEAAVLYNRTEDPTLDERAMERLHGAYNSVCARAEERMALVQKVADEHQKYQNCVHEFQIWLVSKKEELSHFKETEGTSENRLQALRELEASIAQEEEALLAVEGQAEAVKVNTSPAGADHVAVEAEQLRIEWQRLRLALAEVDMELEGVLDEQSRYTDLREELEAGIGELRTLVRRMSQELEGKEVERSEDHMVAQWRKYTSVRNTLLAEEPRVEQLRAQLKELFRFPQHCRELSDHVLVAVKEYQSLKGRLSRLSSESETALRQALQDPLHGFSQWSHMVSQVLETSADVTEFSHIALLVQNIEKLLKHSVQLQERLSLLQVKADLLGAVFGQEKAESLLEELGADVRKRETLHSQLLQRKSELQGLISRTKDFGDAYDSIYKKLAIIRERFQAAEGLQPDILAKKSQGDQLKVIKRDLEECEAHITALETLVSSSPTNRTKFEHLYADWKLLYKAVRVRVNESEESISEHESFHDSLLNVEKWLMIMRQKLESFRRPSGDWSVENRQHEAERALGEFPEKELQLHRTEGQGQVVLAKTSEEGKVHILRDLKRLRESWVALHELSLNLFRLLNGNGMTGETGSSFHTPEALDQVDHSQGFDQRGAQVVGRSVLRGSGPISGDEAVDQPGQELDLWALGSSRGLVGMFALGGTTEVDDWKIHPGGTENIPELTGRTDDEADSFALSRGYGEVGGEFEEGGDFSGAGVGRKGRPRGGEWTGGGVREHLTGIEDVDFQGGRGLASTGHYGSAKQSGAKSPHMPGLREHIVACDPELRHRQPSPYKTASINAAHGPEHVTQRGSQAREQHTDWEARRREFEAWLCKENSKLAGVVNNQRNLSTKELKIRQDALKSLRAGLTQGQARFQELMNSWQSEAAAEDVSLEELRYRWMLYKSKLKDAGNLKANRHKDEGVQEHIRSRKRRCCEVLRRACCAALPLQLLLLALLLLAFLLPLMDEGASCSLSNNFARSFSIMLRYHGPPPT
ncbi:nesprin-3 [Electrophorus electricus]|uniref:nesprin-3 n=1 Tax=Electrophorus electricus TaxID=8005 RepID=UPI0015D0B594|nr:nesprin-3 [Electrophorus electricus]